MQPTYTGRKSIWRDGQDHFAEVTVRAWPSEAPTEVALSTEVLEVLRSVFGEDFEAQRHNVRAAVAAQIDTSDVAGQMPHVGATSFHADVVRVRVSGNAGREVSGFLLSVAGMDAIGEYLVAWETSQVEKGGREGIT
jgi:hypothetical protein